jgi:diguanylate cyclase (GGDEF)-like protein
LKGTYSTEEEIQNLFNKETIKEYVHLDDVESLLGNLLERVEQPGHNRGVYRIKDAKGDYRSFEINMISVAAEGGNKPDVIYGETLLVEDNSYMLEQGAAQEPASRENIAGKILNIARTARARFEDDVTALMSYEDFVEAVQEQLKNRKKEKNYGLLCCDINGFQRLTYHYGISVGDEVLKSFAELLKKHMAYKNLCSRISGDYFVAFFDYEQHTQLLKKISYMLQVQDGIEKKQSYSLNGTTSGIYLIQDEDNDITEMLEKADLARRSIKGIRGNHYAIYTDDLENSRFREVEVLQQIEDSLLEHTIEVCYLPRISGNKENVIGCKAVPRVPLKDGDYLELEDLHRYLDRSERVQQLVFYVLSVVCSNMGAWKANGKKIMPVSLDITFGQLCMQNAVNKIDEIVKANKLEPADIVLEVQEQYFADLTAKIELALRDLSTRGYRVIISRFGSDHTAVHSIRRLPVAGIKFHGEYFRENLRSEKEKIIFQKLVEMAQELGMEVACGGIKTKLQEDAARLIGCDILEGDIYYGTMQSDVYEKCFLNN